MLCPFLKFSLKTQPAQRVQDCPGPPAETKTAAAGMCWCVYFPPFCPADPHQPFTLNLSH